ncbi:hypothetical protein [Pseudomonas aeruginosa]|uniref:hypothetical protein n=1 Tax=Pseudomonas aeruginosa TaxID=287 RepID=UPI002237215D|nr:hypothetical protein [Pseudomonas aeruginosa]MCW4649274.1 hypothetical protein [Pseudomonas aeruginosa]
MTLEEQRLEVMAKYRELMERRNAINDEIADTLNSFFKGKEVVMGHSRGAIEAKVLHLYADGTMTVENVHTHKRSTRLLAEMVEMLPVEEDSD